MQTPKSFLSSCFMVGLDRFVNFTSWFHCSPNRRKTMLHSKWSYLHCPAMDSRKVHRRKALDQLRWLLSSEIWCFVLAIRNSSFKEATGELWSDHKLLLRFLTMFSAITRICAFWVLHCQRSNKSSLHSTHLSSSRMNECSNLSILHCRGFWIGCSKRQDTCTFKHQNLTRLALHS